MKVLFRKPVTPYSVGQVADVAEGYAKNFLIPKRLAVPATAHAVQEAQQQQRNQTAATQDAEHALDQLAQALAGATVHVDAAAASSGTLYAAVTPARIAAALAKHTSLTLPPQIQKQLPTLKRAGKHPVTLQIHATTVTFTLDV